jgi:hypothetical protein
MTKVLIPIASVLLLFCTCAVQIASAGRISQTQVIDFSSPDSDIDVREGACWAVSIAAPRAGAWRCTIGNAVYDPCFNVANKSKRLVCEADPVRGRAGFILKMAGPPPAEAPTPDLRVAAHPWVFTLENGLACYAMTGTVAMTKTGQPAPWSCVRTIGERAEPAGAVTSIETGKVWTAKYFAESMLGPPPALSARLKSQQIPIVKAWR